MRAVGYVRVSTEDQTQVNVFLEAQAEKGHEFNVINNQVARRP